MESRKVRIILTDNVPGALLIIICSYVILAGFIDFLPEYNLYNEKRILQIFVLLFLCLTGLLVLYREITKIINALPTLSKICLVAILTLGLASSASNLNIRYELLEIGLFMLIFFSIITTATIYAKDKVLFEKFLLTTVAVVASLNITIAAAAFFAAITQPISLLPHELFLSFSTVRFFNQIQSWTLPLIVLPLIYFSFSRNIYKTVFILIAASWWWLLFLSGGRGLLLSIIVAFVITLVIYRADAITWLKWQLAACLGGLVIHFALTIISNTGHIIEQYSALRGISSSGRIQLWLYGWELILKQPILGIGPMNYACTAEVSLIAAHPHNSLIQIAVEWGLPAVLLVLVLFFLGIYYWVKFNRISKSANTHEQNHIKISLFATLITASTYSLFSGVIVMPHSQMFMVLILGWMLGIHFSSDILRPSKSIISNIWVVGLLIVSGMLFTSFGIWKGLSFHRHENLMASTQFIQQMPRFWQEGKICP